VDDALLAVEQQRGARHRLKHARQLPAAVSQRPQLQCRVERTAQMRRQPLQSPTTLLGTIRALRRKTEAEPANAAVARHPAMADVKRVLDALRCQHVGVEAGFLYHARLDQRAQNRCPVERLVLHRQRPQIPDMVFVENLHEVRVQSGQNNQVLSARRRVVDQHASDAADVIGNAGKRLGPARRLGDRTIDPVQQLLVVHPRPRIVGLAARRRGFAASRIDPWPAFG